MLAEVGRLTRQAWQSERRGIAAQQEAGALRERVNLAEAAGARAEALRDAAWADLDACRDEKDAWKTRALGAEEQLAGAQALLATAGRAGRPGARRGRTTAGPAHDAFRPSSRRTARPGCTSSAASCCPTTSSSPRT